MLMAQAAVNLTEDLQNEATCPICLDSFKDPVITECSHNFCGACIREYCKESAGKLSCPQCRKTIQPRNFRPNRQLANMVEIAVQLGLEAAKKAEEIVCEEHKESLKLFCEQDQRPICLVCRESQTHRDHTVAPIEEAAQAYKEKLQSSLCFLQTERGKFKPRGEEQSDALLRQTELERQKILFEFEQLHEFLSEHQCLLLAQLEVLDEAILKRRNEYVTKVGEKTLLLGELISELQRKCSQPATEFLKDVGSTLSRCERVKAPTSEPVSPVLKKRVSDFSENNNLVMGVLAMFKENLQAQMDKEKVNVTLDPETANSHLVLSEDGKNVRLGEGRLDVPDNPKRFTSSPSVLGSEGFTTGRHYWELDVGDGTGWAVGVAKETVKRKGPLSLEREGIWAIRLDWDHQYTALTFPPTLLALDEKPRKIRIHLDYEEGQVTFYNAESMAQIFNFSTSFKEKIFPYFWLWSPGSYIQVYP
uniref:RING-type E3 ubiquitin transferase n=1 Tax=Pelodiscus sinensis TaxID=13735 RepID=K7FKU0_PELSI|nr:E3 ubiquitin-protein ligase TRIM39-like isoform X1 [Pelodiscus sinensis]|eukprot:XP_006127847.1 E3 ubiquitin-protein ligase TRIM39-like isoform X1 [Pelodiscus sinensis]